MPIYKVKYDHSAATEAKMALAKICPFCNYTGKSNNVRRHINSFHKIPSVVTDETLCNGKTYRILDAEHPKIVISSDGQNSAWYKHQAYCFGCDHRIMCLSKNPVKATEECLAHTCVEKQVRTTSRESSVAEPPGIQWKEVYEEMFADQKELKQVIQDAIESEEGDDIIDYKSRIHTIMGIICRKVARLDLMEKAKQLQSSQTDTIQHS